MYRDSALTDPRQRDGLQRPLVLQASGLGREKTLWRVLRPSGRVRLDVGPDGVGSP